MLSFGVVVVVSTAGAVGAAVIGLGSGAFMISGAFGLSGAFLLVSKEISVLQVFDECPVPLHRQQILLFPSLHSRGKCPVQS